MVISTSKIRKIIVIKKNRKEKGRREDLLGSNPHSNGDLFSRSWYDFFDKIEAINIIIHVIIKIKEAVINREKIIYIKLYLNLIIGSYIYFYTI